MKKYINIFLSVIFLSGFAFSKESNEITFYCPEANINDFKHLKSNFDNYLAQYGNYCFQPFRNRNEFEEYIAKNHNGLILMSDWHLDIIKKKLSLCPVLMGYRNGKNTQTEIMVAKIQPIIGNKTQSDAIYSKMHTNIPLVKGNIASSRSVNHTISIIKDIISTNDLNPALEVLSVPKDIDALMAVGFGVCKYAVSTKHTLTSLSKINRLLYKKLQVIGKESDSLLIICAQRKKSKTKNLLKILTEIDKSPEGRRLMQILAIDNFKMINH